MFDRVSEAEATLRHVVADLDPDVLEGSVAAALVERFAAIERLAAAGKALAGRRAARSGAWRRDGHRSSAHWMAATAGTSVGHAVGVLETAERLATLPRTDEAVRAGKLSETQPPRSPRPRPQALPPRASFSRRLPRTAWRD